MDPIFIVAAVPIFFLFMVGEWLIARRRGRGHYYRFADSLTNVGNGIGEQVIAIFVLPITVGIYTLVWQHARLHTMGNGVAAWLALFVLLDFLYFLFHWGAHRINFLWATHVVHHQSEEYNFSVALRQSWLQQLVEWPFFIPLALMGFRPEMFMVTLTLNTLYQFFIHTRLVGKLGFLEHFMNTPSHHRVHHGVNPRYIDRNYAGVFIIWDKLFGTFEPEGDEPVYGLVKPLGSFNALWANVHYWVEMASMSRRTRRLGDKLRAWVAPPEWKPDDLGGIAPVPEPTRSGPSLLATPNRARDLATLASFLAVTAGLCWFLYQGSKDATAPLVLVVGLAVLGATVAWGALYRPAPAEADAGDEAATAPPLAARAR